MFDSVHWTTEAIISSTGCPLSTYLTRTRAPSRVNFWGGCPYCRAMMAFCWRLLSSCPASEACPSGGNGRTATIFAVGCRLGTAILIRKLAAESMSMAGQCCDSMLFRIAALLSQLHCTAGILARAVSPSGLCTVYLRSPPTEWHHGSRVMAPANFQPVGTSSVYAVIWYRGSVTCAWRVPVQDSVAAFAS